MSDSNANKSAAGQFFKKKIFELLEELVKSGVLKSYNRQLKLNHEGFSEPQYLANFILETWDEKYMIVNTSNSYRTDRIKGFFYDFSGIMQNWSERERVIAYISVFPDEELNNGSFKLARNRFRNQETFLPITHLFTVSEFESYLSEYGNISVSELQEELELKTEIYDGSYYGKSGNQFERDLVTELRSVDNLIAFTNSNLDPNSFYSIIISKILEDNHKSRSHVVKIEASNKIPMLLSGGNPKADVRVDIELKHGKTITETISLKKTKENQVTCHDYTYQRFSSVLNCEGSKLEDYFRLFQLNPTYSRFEEKIKLSKGYTIEEFKSLLKPHARKLTEWVLTGKHDHENLIFPKSQISNYLLIRTPNHTTFNSMSEYINILIQEVNQNMKYRYEIPFSWTYPSKQEGKRIQLKVAVPTYK